MKRITWLISLSLVWQTGLAAAQSAVPQARISLMPTQGKMLVGARVPGLGGQVFALNIPETIGAREAMILNFPEVTIRWEGPDESGAVWTTWSTPGRIRYTARLVPAEDYVDVEMTIENLSRELWHDVFAFNCLNPVNAPQFRDRTLERTYMSVEGRPLALAKTTRVRGPRPLCFYLPERIPPSLESSFVRGFRATSPDRTDGSWIVTLSEAGDAYMAATTADCVFLFDNLEYSCIHSAPHFGDIGPGESSHTLSRMYVAKGSLEDFLKRYEADAVALAEKQRRARPLSKLQR